MTREEQIRKYAEEKCILYDSIGFDGDIYSLITETIKWADENPKEHSGKELLYVCEKTYERTKKEFIKKACEYLESLTYQDYSGGPLERLIDDYTIKQFCKKMKE